LSIILPLVLWLLRARKVLHLADLGQLIFEFLQVVLGTLRELAVVDHLEDSVKHVVVVGDALPWHPDANYFTHGHRHPELSQSEMALTRLRVSTATSQCLIEQLDIGSSAQTVATDLVRTKETAETTPVLMRMPQRTEFAQEMLPLFVRMVPGCLKQNHGAFEVMRYANLEHAEREFGK
jgi:hypothetical protein